MHLLPDYRIQINLTDGQEHLSIIWITERPGGKGGVSIGYFGSSHGLHSTYHHDGTFHFTSLGGAPLGDTKKIPIDDISDYFQLQFQALPLNSQSMGFMGSRAGASRTPNKILTLSIDDFAHTLGIDSSFVRKGAESLFLEGIRNVYLGDESHHELIGIEFIGLRFFKNHRLALTLLSEK